MKIAEFTDSFLPIVDGVGRVVQSYAEALSRHGQECYVIAPMNDTGFRGGQAYELLDFHSVPLIGQQYKLGLPIVDTHFHSRMKAVELDIIHAHSPFAAGQTAYNYAKKREIPLVGTFHSKYRDDFYQATGMNVVANVAARYVADFFDKCDEVWAVSEDSVETLREYGFKKPVLIMPNGMDVGSPEGLDAQEVREKFSLGTQPVFLFVGQINWKKNIERVLCASKMLMERGRSFKLVFAGKGPHLEEIKQKTQVLGLSDRVVFTGHIADERALAGLYKCATLFVFPSLYDTAGLVVREAAEQGTPSVAVRGSGPSEVIRDRENGLLCEDTSESLASAMEFALTNPEDTKMMGQNAKKTIPVYMDDVIERVIERYWYLSERKKAQSSV